MEVKIYPDSILKEKAENVEEINDNIIKILNEMKETMYRYNGIGLAAEQVGILQKLVVIDTKIGDESKLIELINPEIIASEGTYDEHDEGCLSIPEYYGVVKNRKKYVKVKYLDKNGNEQTIETDEFLSVVLQHEIDHLNGIVFIDRMSRIRRTLFKKQWKKIKTKEAAKQ